eukprot:5285232-Prymnesium_polylepis.1
MSDFDETLYLGSGADQLLVYRGLQTSPTFLCALDNSAGFTGGYATAKCSGSTGGWGQAVCETAYYLMYYSALPPGLTEG